VSAKTVRHRVSKVAGPGRFSCEAAFLAGGSAMVRGEVEEF
jgi:hypothetical protein